MGTQQKLSVHVHDHQAGQRRTFSVDVQFAFAAGLTAIRSIAVNCARMSDQMAEDSAAS